MGHLCFFCGRTHSHTITDVIIYCVKQHVQIISFSIFFLQKSLLCVKYIEHLFLQIFFSQFSKELGKLEIEVMLFNSIKLCHLFSLFVKYSDFFLALDSVDRNLFVTNYLSFLLLFMHRSIQASTCNRVPHPTKSTLGYQSKLLS